MAKSFQLVVVSRSYKDWNSAAGTVKVLAQINNFGPKFVWFYFLILYRPYANTLNDFQWFFFIAMLRSDREIGLLVKSLI